MKTLREQIALIIGDNPSTSYKDDKETANQILSLLRANLPPVLTDEDIGNALQKTDMDVSIDYKCSDGEIISTIDCLVVAQAQRDSILKWLDQPLNPEKGNE